MGPRSKRDRLSHYDDSSECAMDDPSDHDLQQKGHKRVAIVEKKEETNSAFSIIRAEVDHSQSRVIADSFVVLKDGQFRVKIKLLRKFVSTSDAQLIALVLEHLPFTLLDLVMRDEEIFSMAFCKHVDLEYVADCCMKRCEFLERKRSINQDKHGIEVKDGQEAELLSWLSVYSPSGRAFSTFKTRALTSNEMLHVPGPDVLRPSVGQLSVVSTLNRFKRNLEAFCKVPLVCLQLGSQTLLMGGAVVACLRPLPSVLEKQHAEVALIRGDFLTRRLPSVLVVLVQQFLPRTKAEKKLKHTLETHYDKLYHDSDIDVFMSVVDVPARQTQSVAWASKFETILRPLVPLDPETDVVVQETKETTFFPAASRHPDKANMHFVRTPNALTVVGLDPYRNVQIIACERRRPIDLLMDFDLDACGAAFDGSQVWVLPRTRRSLNTQTNFVDPFVIRFLRNRKRLAKYDERGFQMLLFETCVHSPRCDVKPNMETKDWWALCLRTVETARANRAHPEGAWVANDTHAEPRFVPGTMFNKWRYQDKSLKFGRISSDFGFGLDNYNRANPLCSVCVAVNEPILRAQQRLCVPIIEHDAGHLSAFFSRLYGRHIQLNAKDGLCDSHMIQYRSTHTNEWIARREREVEEEDGPLTASQAPSEDRLQQFDLLSHDGLVYPDEQIPIRALNRGQILKRLNLQAHADRELHVRLYGQTVPYVPRVEHAATLQELWKIELKERTRPPIGRNPERIMNLCYMCGLDIANGEFADRLCRGCADVNQKARELTADLSQRVALITGARCKLGFQCAIKLLQCGVTVVGLTRFPRAALQHYKAEADYNVWKHRLFLHSLDLRQTPSLMAFLETFLKLHKRLDIIINNAAQTVRRPPAYFHDLIEKETNLPTLGEHEWTSFRNPSPVSQDIMEKVTIAQKFLKKRDGLDSSSRFRQVKEGKPDPALPLTEMYEKHKWLAEYVIMEQQTERYNVWGYDSLEWGHNKKQKGKKSKQEEDAAKKKELLLPCFQTSKLDDFVEKHRNTLYLAAPRRPLYTPPHTVEELNAKQSPPSTSILSSSSSSSSSSLPPFAYSSSCPRPPASLDSHITSSSSSSSSSSLDEDDDEKSEEGDENEGDGDEKNSHASSSSSSSSSSPSSTTSFPASLMPSFPMSVPAFPFASPFVLPGDHIVRDDAWFPVGQTDRHGEQMDLRPFTSWNATISQVNLLEMLEVQFVNVVAPFLIVSALGPLIRDGRVEYPRFVINVSSQEGQFHTELPKKSFHPHTNMAKAALNMLTRTTAVEFMQDNVSVLSIDPGWVSDMRPTTRVKLEKLPTRHGDPGTSTQVKRVAVAPPLTVGDGVARILHPILQYTDVARSPPCGVLLKHFQVEAW